MFISTFFSFFSFLFCIFNSIFNRIFAVQFAVLYFGAYPSSFSFQSASTAVFSGRNNVCFTVLDLLQFCCLCQIFFFATCNFFCPVFCFFFLPFLVSTQVSFHVFYLCIHVCTRVWSGEGTIICLVRLVLGFPATSFPACCSFIHW